MYNMFCKKCGSEMIPVGAIEILEYNQETGKPKTFQEHRCKKNPCHYPPGHDWKYIYDNMFLLKNLFNGKLCRKCKICELKDIYEADY